MSAWWIAAGAVSVCAHLGFAAYVDSHEVTKKVRPPLEMQLAKLVPKVPPPPPPPPPPPAPPKLVAKKIVKTLAAPPPPPEVQKVGISDDATTDKGEIAIATGVTTDGVLGTGTSMDKEAPPPTPPPPPAPAPKRVTFFPSYEVTKLPRAKSAVQPEIPQAFRDAQREALVVVEVEIDASGNVVSARVLKHADFGLDDAALAAAKKTAFEPALMGSQPVPVRFQIPYRFKVRG